MTEDVVEQRALDQVRVLVLAGGQQEPPAQHDRRDARAGLRVGAVGRQLEVIAERLVLVMRADSAGDVRTAGHAVRPLPANRRLPARVTGLGRDVSAPDGEVEARTASPRMTVARGPACRPGSTPGRRMPAQGTGSAALHEQAGEFKVAVVPGRAGQLRERHLDFRMTAHAHPTARAELVVDVIGQAARDLRQQVVVTSPQPGDRRLEQVAEAVQLMPGLQI